MAGRRVHLMWAGSTLAAVVAIAALVLAGGAQVSTPLPDRLDDREFWRVSQEFSESDGTFHSENLVSNEIRFQTIIPALVDTVPTGRAYVGVGSEQNFTYMAAVRPSVAFIVDLRRGNLDLHLVYKTFFELSVDRAEFVSRVFARPRPDGLTATSSVDDIFAAFAGVPGSETLYAENLETVYTHLTKTRGFAISEGDREGIRFVYRSWFEAGPDIHYQLTGRGGRGGRGGGFPTYADLMTTTDGQGRHRSYLATEETFRWLKDLQTRNLVIPVVGNFGGPKALRAVAGWLRQHDATVGAFYTSNVEQYLWRDGLWEAFCASASTFPLDDASTFIRSERGGFAGAGNRGMGGFWLELEPIAERLAPCATPVAGSR